MCITPSHDECRIRFIYNPRIRALVLAWSGMTRDDLLTQVNQRFLHDLVCCALRDLDIKEGHNSSHKVEHITSSVDCLGNSVATSEFRVSSSWLNAWMRRYKEGLRRSDFDPIGSLPG